MEEEPPTEQDTILGDFFMDLKKNDTGIVVPRDKTNWHRLVAIEDYIQWVKGHMKEAARLIKKADIIQLHQCAMIFDLSLKELLNEDELGYLLKKLNSRAILEPQLLIKGHKEMKHGHYPIRL
eukprot:11246364-Ditylum_brightwellii.AAC.1